MAETTEDSGRGEFWAGLLVGGLIGATAAILFAPSHGRQTRQQIADTGVELGGRARGLAEDAPTLARDAATEIAARGRAIIEGGKAALDDAIAGGKEEADRVSRQLRDRFEEVRGKAPEEPS